MFALYVDVLTALEQSALGHASRHSAWLFTIANVLHVLGAAFLVGGIAVFDLKVLRDGGRGAATVGRIAVPLAALGLAVQVPTGLVLLSVEATKLGVNPAFYAKLAFIAVGLAIGDRVSRDAQRQHESQRYQNNDRFAHVILLVQGV